ncbi:MAG: glycosyltransferase family 2 protein [Planctomycetota bacterium]
MTPRDASLDSLPATPDGARRTLPVPRRVGLVIGLYRNAEDIGPCLESVFADAAEHPGIELTVVVVDDASVDDGPAAVAERFPRAELLRLERNVGFAAANNAGVARLRELVPDVEFVTLLNADTVVRGGWLAELIAYLDAHGEAGAVQPKVLLHDAPGRINTVGNRVHYLGFGMMTGYGEPDDGRFDAAGEIDFASGCAVMVRGELIDEAGPFDPAFGMYLEDADLGLRLHAMGRPPHYCPSAAVLHRYTPDAPTKAYFNLERNRWLMLLTYWPWALLAAVSPMLALMELMQVGYSVAIGRPGARARVWASLLSGEMRRTIARRRALGHRVRAGQLVPRVDLPGGGPWVLRAMVNPVMAGWWRAVRRLLGVRG